MVMVHSDWGCLDYTGLPRSMKLLLYEQHWANVMSAAARDADHFQVTFVACYI